MNNNLPVDRTENYEMAERIVVDSKTNYPAGIWKIVLIICDPTIVLDFRL